MGHKFTLYKKERSPFYYFECIVGGVRRERSLETADKEAAVIRAQIVWQRAREERWAPKVEAVAKVVASLGAVLSVYEEHVGSVSEKIDPGTARKNAGSVRRLVEWARGKAGVPARDLDFERVSAEVLTASLIDAAVTNYKLPAGDDAEAMDSRRRGAASMVRQARSVFKKEALRLYRDRGLHLPELRGFLQERRVSAPIAVHRSIDAGMLREMDAAARELKVADPALYLAHLAFKFLGLRNSEIAEAVLGCFEQAPAMTDDGKPWGQWFFAMTTRGTFRPKASQGVVPMCEEVVDEFAAVLGDRLDGDAEALNAAPLIAMGSATERAELLDRRHSEFMRQFLPAGQFKKSSYELRRWGTQIMEARYGREAALAFVRHTPKTVAERHYLERWFPWSRFGTNIGITLADAAGPVQGANDAGEWKRGAAALRARRVATV